MDEEDVRVRRPQTGFQRPLVGLSVAELEAYLRALDEERERVEAEIRKKRDVRSAADALFKTPAGR